MMLRNTNIFAFSHLIMPLTVFIIYTQKSYQPILLVLSILFLLWSLLLIYSAKTSNKALHNRSINLIILVDILLISAVYYLPDYPTSTPLWIITFLIPFYAQELGSKAALKISVLGTISLVAFNLWIESNYVISIAIFLEMLIFIVFIGRKKDRLNKLAFYDELTGLYNRTNMRNTINANIELASGNLRSHSFYYIFLDLDHFKEVNDTYGHDTGDALLQVVAQRMKKVVPDHGSISRMGGDEFTILLPIKQGDNELQLLVEKLLYVLKQPVILNEIELEISVSVGISFFPQDGKDALTLLKNADTAMYSAKHKGRNGYMYYAEVKNLEAT